MNIITYYLAFCRDYIVLVPVFGMPDAAKFFCHDCGKSHSTADNLEDVCRSCKDDEEEDHPFVIALYSVCQELSEINDTLKELVKIQKSAINPR